MKKQISGAWSTTHCVSVYPFASLKSLIHLWIKFLYNSDVKRKGCVFFDFGLFVCFFQIYHLFVFQLLHRWYLLRFSRNGRYIWTHATGTRTLPDPPAWQECWLLWKLPKLPELDPCKHGHKWVKTNMRIQGKVPRSTILYYLYKFVTRNTMYNMELTFPPKMREIRFATPLWNFFFSLKAVNRGWNSLPNSDLAATVSS